MTKKLSALAHPVRLAVVRMLVRAGPKGLAAGKLGESVDIPSNALTFHLQKLANVGLIMSRREGQFIIYSAGFDDLLNLVNNLVSACCADTNEKCGSQCPTSTCGSNTISPLNGDQND